MYRSLTFYTSKKVVKVIGYSSQTDSKAEEVCHSISPHSQTIIHHQKHCQLHFIVLDYNGPVSDFYLLALKTNLYNLFMKQKWVELPVPADMQVGMFADQILLQLRSDWAIGEDTYVI